MAQKKVNMFTADKEFASRVNEFMHTQVWSAVIRKRLQMAKEKYAQKLENLENLKGSIITPEQIEALKVEFASELTKTEEDLQALADKERTFEYTKADNEFYKEYKKAESTEGIKSAVQSFCESYNLKIANTDFLEELTIIISGEKGASASTIIRSGATKFTQARSKGDVLKVLYGRLAEKMLEAGTLKPQSIPEDIREAYAKKNK